MRQILSLMRDFRLAELDHQAKIRKSRLAPEHERRVRYMFEVLDAGLNSVAFDGGGDEFREVMTSGDFTNAIQTFVMRQMVPAYEAKRFDFERFIKPRPVTNFLYHQDHQRRSFSDDLEAVGSKGKARPGSVDDSTRRDYRVYGWEKQYDFAFQMLWNDNMGYFQDQARVMGIDARRTLEKHVSNWLFNATTVAALVALGALYSTNGRLTSARISTARMGFNQRTDARGEPIAAGLRYIVHHSGLVDVAAQIQASTLVPELATNAVNVVRGTFEPIEDPHLAGTAPNLPWMGLADWRANNIAAFILARLNNVPGPMILRKRSDIEQVTSVLGGGAAVAPLWGDFDSGNIVLKVMDIWGTYISGTDGNLYDVRGAYHSTGTAP